MAVFLTAEMPLPRAKARKKCAADGQITDIRIFYAFVKEFSCLLRNNHTEMTILASYSLDTFDELCYYNTVKIMRGDAHAF